MRYFVIAQHQEIKSWTQRRWLVLRLQACTRKRQVQGVLASGMMTLFSNHFKHCSCLCTDVSGLNSRSPASLCSASGNMVKIKHCSYVYHNGTGVRMPALAVTAKGLASGPQDLSAHYQMTATEACPAIQHASRNLQQISQLNVTAYVTTSVLTCCKW